MGTSRRVAGRRGSYRPAGTPPVLESRADRYNRRHLRNMPRNQVSTNNGQASVVTVPHDLEDYYLAGRPMPELFGCQDLRE